MNTSQYFRSPYEILPQQKPVLLKAFWGVAIVTFLLIVTREASVESIIGALGISFLALLPSYLWCRGIAKGIPIMPLLSLTFLWTYALPLVSQHPKIIIYSGNEQLQGAITVIIFLAISILSWILWVNNNPTPPAIYRSLPIERGDIIFLSILGLAIIYQSIANTNLLWIFGVTTSILRAIILGLNTLGVFVLSYRLGRKELSKNKANIFTILFTIYLLSNGVSLYLISLLASLGLSIIGFTVGSRRVPWKTTLIIVLICSFLHIGKAEMREQYWIEGNSTVVRPWQYTSLYLQWMDYSFNNLIARSTPESYYNINLPKKQEISLFQRSSIIQRLLLIQDKSPQQVPYLKGYSYSIIPQLLVPRFLNPNKFRTGEGNHILTVRYGLQSYEGTKNTSIGWGLLPESYANFGLLGVIALAIVLGNFYGFITRWCMQTPLFSFRSLFAIIALNTAFQSEWTAGIFLSATFQTTVGLLLVSWLLMKARWHDYYLQDNMANNVVNNSRNFH